MAEAGGAPRTPPTRWLVLYPGARLGYAVPALLARHGMLARFYTDLHAPAGGPLAALGRLPAARLPRPLARLLGRRLPPELEGLVTSVPLATLAAAALSPLARRGLPLAVPDAEARLRDRVLADGFGGAGGLYTMSSADLPLVRAARARGLKIVHEQIITPHVGRTVRSERLAYPGLEPLLPEAEIEAGLARDVEQWRLSDLVLAPSDFARAEILSHGLAPERVVTVPYGVHEAWLEARPAPVPGRLLFVGSAVLRKGVQHLAAASRLLAARGVAHEARVVGPVTAALRAHPAMQGVTFAGQVPRSQVRAEFEAADLFVFPTLAEGCALVHLEALAAGLPVITTAACGPVLRDGVEGFVVLPGDAAALAGRIEALLLDRPRRDAMAAAARARAREFTWARYGERLLAALRALDGR